MNAIPTAPGLNWITAESKGNKSQLILLPGMVCNHAAWAAQIQALADVAAIAVPEYGFLNSFTEMAHLILKHVEGRFSVAGHSMGGRIALELYRLAPERIERLCLLSSGHQPRPDGPAGDKEDAIRLELLDTARRQGMRAMADTWIPRLVAREYLEDASRVEYLRGMIEQHTPQHLEAQISAGQVRPDHTPLLPGIRCPALLIAGAADAVRPAKVLEQAAETIPDARLHVVPDCGHMPMMEEPELISSLLCGWLMEPAGVNKRPARARD